MTTLSPTAARHLWVGLMTVASTVTTLALACATPFPALAALAATQVRRTEGVMLMGAAWAISQAVGFCLLDYPLNAKNLAWASALGSAAISALLVARFAVARLGNASSLARLVIAYVAAYVGFKAVLLGWVMALDDGWAAFSTEILARQFVRYGAILIGLVVLHRLLGLAGIRGANTPVAA